MYYFTYKIQFLQIVLTIHIYILITSHSIRCQIPRFPLLISRGTMTLPAQSRIFIQIFNLPGFVSRACLAPAVLL